MASSPRTVAASSRVRSGASAMINRPGKLPEIASTPQTDEPEPCALTDARCPRGDHRPHDARVASRGAGNDPRRGAASVLGGAGDHTHGALFQAPPRASGARSSPAEGAAQGRAAILPRHEDRRQSADVLPEPEEIRRQPCRGPGGRRRATARRCFKRGQRGYAVLGQLYARVKLFEGQFLSLYRQIYDTPYMNRNDSRMTPNTFEGYSLQGTLGGKDGEPALRYGGGEVRLVSSARRRGAVRGAVHGRAQRGWRPPQGLRLPHRPARRQDRGELRGSRPHARLYASRRRHRYPKAVERQPRLHQRHGAELRSRG